MKIRKKYYHLIECELFEELTLKLSKKGRKKIAGFSILGISSKEKIKTALKYVRKSPFKTVFVVDENISRVIFAITQNPEYVTYAKKRKGGGDKPRLPPDTDQRDCCAICSAAGADGCMLFENYDCMCLYEDGGGGRGGMNWNEPLETISPPR